ncbi:MAG: VWD domain-containing protein [Elainella sp. Prado103]|jgi:hypothetical protein|nr:VWD domain-containing protein [Elainella sp. Prado103]
MRWARLAFISLFSFLFVTCGTLFKKLIALLLCSIFTLNALTCSIWIGGENRAIAVVSPNAARVSLKENYDRLIGEIPRRRIQNGGSNTPLPLPRPQQSPQAPLPIPRPEPGSNAPLPVPRPFVPAQPTNSLSYSPANWGLDRWWATAGDQTPMPVTLTVQVYKADEYELNINTSNFLNELSLKINQWDLNSEATISIDSGEPTRIDGLLSDSGRASLGLLETGTHWLRIDGFDIPQNPVVEQVSFQLIGSEDSEMQEFNTLFIADQSPANIANIPLLTEQFAPTLNFDTRSAEKYPQENPGIEKYWIPLDAESTTWEVAKQAFEANNFLSGDAEQRFDLPKGSEFFKGSIYAAVVQNPRNPRQVAINYYFHYPYSNWQDHKGFNNHEGDWEGITVFLEQIGDRFEPKEVAFAQHVAFSFFGGGGQKIPWAQVEKTNNHPEVYVGLGGHASYPKAGCSEWPNVASNSPFKYYNEYHNGGKPVHTWVINLPRVKEIPLEEWHPSKPWAWLLYPGFWGEPNQCTDNAGGIGCPSAPRGPVFLDLDIELVQNSGSGRRWVDPWGWAAGFSSTAKSECEHDEETKTSDHPLGTGNKIGAKDYGDPHMVTFDGHRYSFQTVGEYVVAKSTDGYFQVQGRQSPVNRNLSLNSAVAMQVGSDRVAFYSKDFPDSDTSTPLRINGRPTTVQGESLSLPGGGTIYKKNENNYVVEWDTGEQVAVNIYQRGQYKYMDVFPFVFESQAGRIIGLLGDADGNPDNDLRFRNGNLLPTKSTYGDLNQLINNIAPVQIPLGELEKLYFQELNRDFGSSWRVTPEESLFDYAPGQTTDSFTDRAFPDAYLTLDMLPPEALQTARAACSQAGVESSLMEGCIFDVGFTGYSEFAYRAAQVSNILEVVESVIPGFQNPIPEIIRRLPRIPGINF